MKTILIVSLAITGATGIFGFNLITPFSTLDNCLDCGGSWNGYTQYTEFQTTDHEFQKQSLIETVWTSKNARGGYDSLTFISDTDVTYYSDELSWNFSSTYSVEDGLLTILTKTFELDVDDVSKFDPNLKMQYQISERTLILTYLANLRNGSWQVATAERMNQLNKYDRIK